MDTDSAPSAPPAQIMAAPIIAEPVMAEIMPSMMQQQQQQHHHLSNNWTPNEDLVTWLRGEAGAGPRNMDYPPKR